MKLVVAYKVKEAIIRKQSLCEIEIEKRLVSQAKMRILSRAKRPP